jgi:transcriptional regulator with XRE-family HTH domain
LDGQTLRKARERRGWNQSKAAERLGVSQTYVALLENNVRRVPPKLARKAVRIFGLSPEFLPPTGKKPSAVTADELTRDLSRLGYPGFAYVRGGWMKNPGEVLVAALARPELESRLAEALPWVLLNYPDLDTSWLVNQSRQLNLTNRLGFVVDLALRVAEKNGGKDSARYRALTNLGNTLRLSRLDVEDTFAQGSLTDTERNWLRSNRSAEAEFWHLLTDWRPEFLQYAQ